MRIWNSIIMGLGLSLIVIAVDASEAQFKYVMCRNSSIVRTIRAEWFPKVDGCTTTYTKNGVDRQIGEGKFFDSCVGFLNNVQGNLEKAGWNCKDISGAQIHKTKKQNAENN